MLVSDTTTVTDRLPGWARHTSIRHDSLAAIASGDMAQARKLLREAVDANPDDAAAHLGLAWVLKEQGEVDAALPHAERAAILTEGDSEGWRLLSELLRAKMQRIDRRLVQAQAALSQAKTRIAHDEQQNSDLGYRHELLGYTRDYMSGFISVSQVLPVHISSADGALPPRQVMHDDFEGPAADLESRGLHAEAALLRALDRGIRIDPYEAALLFFTWLYEASPSSTLSVVDVSDAFLGRPRHEAADHRLTLILGGEAVGTIESRVQSLFQLANACTRLHSLMASGTMNRVLAVAEGITMALARHCAATGTPDRVMGLIDHVMGLIGWTSGGRTFHLRTVKHCVELVSRGEPIPPHLRKFVCKDDDGYLKERFCEHPFTRFDMMHGSHGNLPVQVCCSHWLPTVIGDLRSGAEAVLNSPVVQDIRRSMMDGSFKYCDHLNCQTMCNNALPKKADLKDPELRHAIDTGDVTVTRTRDILFGIDETCNLSCPSCRTSVYAASKDRQKELIGVVEQTILPLLSRADSIMINPAGEVFASAPARRVLDYISDETCPDLKVRIISNGTRFSEDEWNRFPGIHNKTEYVRVSLDGTTKETFEKLRRGAYYEETWNNLAFLSRLRKQGTIQALLLSYTYQLDNFHEMPAFVQMGIDLGADALLFERLMNMGAFTSQEYEERAVHMLTHPRYHEFEEVLRNPLMRRTIVRGDLAWLRTAAIDEGHGEAERPDGTVVWSVDVLAKSGEGQVDRVSLERVPGPGPQGEAETSLMAEDGHFGNHRIEFILEGILPERVHTVEGRVKPQGRGAVMLEMRDGDAVKYGVAVFDLLTGTLRDSRGDILDARITPGADGWFHVWAAMPFDRARAVFNFALVNPEGTHVYQGDGSSGILMANLALTQGLPDGVVIGGEERPDGTVVWSADDGIAAGVGVIEQVAARRVTLPGPLGQESCALLTEDADHAQHRIHFDLGDALPKRLHTVAFWAKPQGRNALRLEIQDGATSRYGVAFFDLSAGAVLHTTGDVAQAGVIPGPSGWMRIWAAMPIDDKRIVFNLALVNEEGTHLYTGNGQGGVLLSRGDVTQGAAPAA